MLKLFAGLLLVLGCATTPRQEGRHVEIRVVNESAHDATLYLARAGSTVRSRLGEVPGHRGTLRLIVAKNRFASSTQLAVREVAGGEWVGDPLNLPPDAHVVLLTIAHDGRAPHGYVSYR